MIDRTELRKAAEALPSRSWFAEINPTSAWVGTPKGVPPHQKCDDVFFGEEFDDYTTEHISRTVALFTYIALEQPGGKK